MEGALTSPEICAVSFIVISLLLGLVILVAFVTNNEKVSNVTDSSSYDLKDFTPYLLNLAAETASLGFQEHYRSKYGMLLTEWRVLFHLGHYGPMHAKDICTRARIHKTKVSRAVAALEKKRYLVRDDVEEDRRYELLKLTKNGQSVFNELFKAAQTFDEDLNRHFTPQERETLRKCLLQIAEL